MGRRPNQPEAVRQQKQEAQAVKDDGFEGLQILIKDLNQRATELTKTLIHSDDVNNDFAVKSEIRVIEYLIKKYMGYIRIDTD